MRGSPSRGVFDVEIIDQRPGLTVFRAQGARAAETFRDEAGGHRWQRVPPNERRDRVHTSTVTVAVLPEPPDTEVRVTEADVTWTATRGSGPGGQNRNKTNTCVQMIHKATGLAVRCENERSQEQNRKTAMALLRAKLWEARASAAHAQAAQDRRSQVGSGQRGDKRRTIRAQDDQVTDHVTGRRWRLKDYLRGEW